MLLYGKHFGQLESGLNTSNFIGLKVKSTGSVIMKSTSICTELDDILINCSVHSILAFVGCRTHSGYTTPTHVYIVIQPIRLFTYTNNLINCLLRCC